MTKLDALLDLARQRQSMRLEGYAAVGDFHDGLFECDHVSPWTKSGGNVNADVMVVGQDWASSDMLSNDPPDREGARLGYDPSLPTNRNLDDLLARHFGLQRAHCYLTNLFPFIKPGRASAGIGQRVLIASAQQFTLREIEIVSPQVVLCLGLRTFIALRRAAGHRGAFKMAQAVASPFTFADATIYCLAHTGALGMNNRGREQVDQDWQRIAAALHSCP